MEWLSPNFTLEELCNTQTRLRNAPTAIVKERLRALCLDVLQPLRDHFGAVIVTSGYRCPAVNRAVGGAAGSQHTRGEAADLQCDRIAEAFEWLRLNVHFDQLIWEKGDDRRPLWIHVSHVIDKPERGQVLRLKNGRYLTY